jgi:hypothetical protein
LNLWNSFAWEHIVKRSDLVPLAAFELHSSRPKKYGQLDSAATNAASGSTRCGLPK